ncbi:unnamed protein product [Symbiodinium necroappetens]|uniref:Uncharacterized protein n=1 Tax=Symbiodinium necroappetens TaxID=1628268 RepID=A0A812N429_9DINO|nr:unnamed protein product [Symbiodinium necroappetens]
MDGSMALSEPSSWWNVWAKPADEVLSATSFATFLLLCTLGLTRAMLGLALWLGMFPFLMVSIVV